MPRPGCRCRVCEEARHKGPPYSRTGPSIFVHGPDVLIDTPEEIKAQLNRAGIERVQAGLYSHWHPDHTAGRRVWETMNGDFLRWPPQHRTTPIYLPPQVARDFERFLGLAEHFRFLEKWGFVQVHVLAEGDTLILNGWAITPIQLADPSVYAFLFHRDDRRVLIAPDELVGWTPPPHLRYVDVAVLPVGIFEFDPLTGERRFPIEHKVLEIEATFEQTLEIVAQLQPQRVIFTHIEELNGYSFDDLKRLEAHLRHEGLNVTFAWDGMKEVVR